jgi:hypothetical protein
VQSSGRAIAEGRDAKRQWDDTIRIMDKPTSPSTVSVDSQGQRLVLEKREAVLKRLFQRFEQIPIDVSLADELIAERRSEGWREERR